MYKKTHDVVYNAGTKEEANWIKVGNMLSDGESIRLKLDVVPTNFNGWLLTFPVKKDGEKSLENQHSQDNSTLDNKLSEKERLIQQLSELL
ncbi:hypothetical protein [Galenea microaerophila]